MAALSSHLEEAASLSRERLGAIPPVAVVLGSGLGILADHMQEARDLAVEDIPHYPPSTVHGHAGRWVAGRLDGTFVLALKGRVHATEARFLRAHTRHKIKFTLPGPMTLIDTLADGYYGDRVKMAFAFAELLNQEAKDLESLGVDVVQFDEPAFNVYLGETIEWGVPALEKAAEGLKCTTAVHICYGYGIEANIKWKETLGESWRQYEQTFPALDRSKIQQVSLECRNSHVPPELMKLLKTKTVLVGAIDVASDKIDTPEEVAATIKLATQFVDPERIQACTNCGMAPMTLAVAYGKLRALAEGAALARKAL